MRDPEAAAEELLTRATAGATPKLVTVFASCEHDQGALNRALWKRLPRETRLIGAATAREIDNDGFHEGTILVAALFGDLEVGLGFGGGVSHDVVAAGRQAMQQACAQLGVQEVDPRSHVGVVLDGGMHPENEALLAGMLERNERLVLVAGSASGAPVAVVHVDGEVVTDGALVALLKTDAPWAALRSHWYEPTGATVRITKIDGTGRRARELDGILAIRRYAELLEGVRVDQLAFRLPRGFATSPTALRLGRESFLRAPREALPDGSLLFAARLREGMELDVMRVIDPLEATLRFFATEVPRRVRNPSAALVFHGADRTRIARAGGFADPLSECFWAAPPCVGFDVDVGTFCGHHVDATLTTLVFGSSG